MINHVLKVFLIVGYMKYKRFFMKTTACYWTDFLFSSKLCFSICYIHLLISEVHDRLGMTDGAWPAEDEIDEVILLYKTSGSNMVRDFYVLPPMEFFIQNY